MRRRSFLSEVTVGPASDKDVGPSSDKCLDKAIVLTTAMTKAYETTKLGDRKYDKNIEQYISVNTEQICAEEDGDKVMRNKRVDDGHAKLQHRSFTYETGFIASGV